MGKPLKITAEVAPASSRQRGVTPPKPGTVTISLKLYPSENGFAHKVPFEHVSGPRSIILLKIIAMETDSENAPRVNRRRQFVKRLGSA